MSAPWIVGIVIASNVALFVGGQIWMRRQVRRVAAERAGEYRDLFKLEPLPPPGEAVLILVEEDGNTPSELDAVHWPYLGWVDACTLLPVDGSNRRLEVRAIAQKRLADLDDFDAVSVADRFARLVQQSGAEAPPVAELPELLQAPCLLLLPLLGSEATREAALPPDVAVEVARAVLPVAGSDATSAGLFLRSCELFLNRRAIQ